ncbi:hypothetical protein HELRODRAFT_169525 [Helobdella robusta]|uniref:Secreted protein n=1 Tax=Helobdella robusta TaxID=6412 RepID=T1F218_HELRO|nr:hypothetical protein HELRODRAFT_169525 [Helobdella robusta]ESO08640.1 hypothetical protein HELRODRAFT_169525 [Helobdella robusta]
MVMMMMPCVFIVALHGLLLQMVKAGLNARENVKNGHILLVLTTFSPRSGVAVWLPMMKPKYPSRILFCRILRAIVTSVIINKNSKCFMVFLTNETLKLSLNKADGEGGL